MGATSVIETEPEEIAYKTTQNEQTKVISKPPLPHDIQKESKQKINIMLCVAGSFMVSQNNRGVIPKFATGIEYGYNQKSTIFVLTL